MGNKKTYERISITIPKDLLKRFRKYCEENSINMSGKISKLIEKELGTSK